MQIDVEHQIGDMPRRLARLPREVREQVLEDLAPSVEEEALSLYRRTVRTWRHQPQFRARSTVRPTRIRVQAGTDDDIFRYVDEGTRAHTIEPRGSGYPLRFRTGYRSKTTPGQLGSRPGGATGPYARAWSVRHPGTRARRFSEMIAKRVLEFIGKALRSQFGGAVRRSIQKVRLGR